MSNFLERGNKKSGSETNTQRNHVVFAYIYPTKLPNCWVNSSYVECLGLDIYATSAKHDP